MTLISFFPEMNAAQAENILNSGESKNIIHMLLNQRIKLTILWSLFLCTHVSNTYSISKWICGLLLINEKITNRIFK